MEEEVVMEEEEEEEVAEGTSGCEICEFKYEFMLLMAEKARLASELAFDMRKEEKALVFKRMKRKKEDNKCLKRFKFLRKQMEERRGATAGVACDDP